ncbi:hypothetical protein Tco_1053338, partial [Tanacetum coccineum]
MCTQSSSNQSVLHIPNSEKYLQFLSIENCESENLVDHIQGEDENAKDIQMADHLRPMEELLRIPIVGIENAIVVPAVLADEFELKTELLDFVSNNSFFGLLALLYKLKALLLSWAVLIVRVQSLPINPSPPYALYHSQPWMG